VAELVAGAAAALVFQALDLGDEKKAFAPAPPAAAPGAPASAR